jgi:hypothetical protein
MSDGREEREEQEQRRKWEKERKDRDDNLDRGSDREWERDGNGSEEIRAQPISVPRLFFSWLWCPGERGAASGCRGRSTGRSGGRRRRRW